MNPLTNESLAPQVPSAAPGEGVGLGGKSFSCSHLSQLDRDDDSSNVADQRERLRLMRQSMHAAKLQGIQLGLDAAHSIRKQER